MIVFPMISRQSRRLAPDTRWLGFAWEAAGLAREREWEFLVGRGFRPQRFFAWAAARRGARLLERRLSGKRSVAAFADRDEAMAREAEAILVVDLRSGGHLERLAREALGSKRVIALTRKGETPPRPIIDLLERGAESLEIDFEIPRPVPFRELTSALPESRDTLWHFTRSFDAPWPGETWDEYFLGLVENRAGAAHTAEDSLGRILAERRIRACARLIKGGRPVVCFTEASPEELLALRMYRSALLRWNFEPFAVGIPKARAAELGIRPVKYLHPRDFDRLAVADRHLFQKHDPPSVDFTPEKEWRSLGDVDLSTLAGSDLLIHRVAERRS